MWNRCTHVLQKKFYSTISRTGNLKKWVVKNRLPLRIWIVTLLCSIFILLWFSFFVYMLCNIYYMIVIFILEIEGYWNYRLAQLPGGAPDTRVTYKVRWFLGSYHVVMSLQEAAMPLVGSHDVSRSVWTDAVMFVVPQSSTFMGTAFEDQHKPTWQSLAAWKLVEYLKYSTSYKHPNTFLFGWFMTPLFSAVSWFWLNTIIHRPEFCF